MDYSYITNEINSTINSISRNRTKKCSILNCFFKYYFEILQENEIECFIMKLHWQKILIRFPHLKQLLYFTWKISILSRKKFSIHFPNVKQLKYWFQFYSSTYRYWFLTSLQLLSMIHTGIKPQYNWRVLHVLKIFTVICPCYR